MRSAAGSFFFLFFFSFLSSWNIGMIRKFEFYNVYKNVFNEIFHFTTKSTTRQKRVRLPWLQFCMCDYVYKIEYLNSFGHIVFIIWQNGKDFNTFDPKSIKIQQNDPFNCNKIYYSQIIAMIILLLSQQNQVYFSWTLRFKANRRNVINYVRSV